MYYKIPLQNVRESFYEVTYEKNRLSKSTFFV